MAGETSTQATISRQRNLTVPNEYLFADISFIPSDQISTADEIVGIEVRGFNI
jgi:hypothetical protein